MKLAQIPSLKDKEIIPSFTAILQQVDPPKPPSDKQRAAGIHTQSIWLEDGNGTRILARIMRESMHIDVSESGRTYFFQSTQQDNNRMDGLIFRKGEYNGKMYETIDINGRAQFYAIPDEEQKVESKQENDSKSPNALPPEANKLDNLIALYGHIYHSLEVTPADLSSATATIFIQACRDNLHRTFTVTPPAQTTANDSDDEIDSVNKLAERIVGGTINSDDIKAHMNLLGAKWIDLYDRIHANPRLSAVPPSVIDEAWDSAWQKKSDVSPSSEGICEIICTDFNSYMLIIDTIMKFNAKPIKK